MPTTSTLVFFVLASYALAVVPGPAVVYIVNRSLGQGRRVEVNSALGIATGGLVQVTAAAVGLSAILMASALAFWRLRTGGRSAPPSQPGRSAGSLVRSRRARTAHREVTAGVFFGLGATAALTK